MPTERGATMPGPDDFDRQLRDLTSGAGTARFREPSAAERAGLAGRAGRATRPAGRRSVMNWRHARRASELRRRRASRQIPGRSRRQRLLLLAKGAAILIGFVALLFLMYMLGLGPR